MAVDIDLVARIVVLLCAGTILVVGLAVLAWERLKVRGRVVEHDAGPLAAVNYVGILGFVAVGAWSAATTAGTVAALSGPVNASIRIVGIVALAAAGLLAAWGIASIGRDMASAPEVRVDTTLVTHGAFAYVRHPMYLSILLLWAGGALALVSWVLAIGAVVLTPAFVARCRLEERLLTAHFGTAYTEYARRVPMLLPRPVPHPRRPPARA